MIEAVSSGRLDASMRRQIAEALSTIKPQADNKKRRGRQPAFHTFQAAALAFELVSKHRVTSAKSAIGAAIKSITERGSIKSRISEASTERLYYQIAKSPDHSMMTKSGEKIIAALITDAVIRDALARVHVSAGRPSDVPANPGDYIIVLAYLYRPID